MNQQDNGSGDNLPADDIEAVLTVSVGEPPAVIDALVSQQAHDAVRGGRKSTTATASGRRQLARLFPVAAVLVVSVGITVQMQGRRDATPQVAEIQSGEADVMHVDVEAALSESAVEHERSRAANTILERSTRVLAPPAPEQSAVTALQAKSGSGASPDDDMQKHVNDIIALLSANEAERAHELVRVWQQDYPDSELMEWLPADMDPALRAMLNQLLEPDPSGIPIPGTPADQ